MGCIVKVCETFIKDLKIIKAYPHKDKRGVFSRVFCENELKNIVENRKILQINYSQTNNIGAVRGLHFQRPPHAEMKLVRCIKGKVWDIAVDLRKDSPTFLRWHAEELTSSNMRMILIPEGFAHGFQVLEPQSELLYLHTAFYHPKSESGLNPEDPTLNIKWPLEITDLSARDARHKIIKKNFEGISL